MNLLFMRCIPPFRSRSLERNNFCFSCWQNSNWVRFCCRTMKFPAAPNTVRETTAYLASFLRLSSRLGILFRNQCRQFCLILFALDRYYMRNDGSATPAAWSNTRMHIWRADSSESQFSEWKVIIEVFHTSQMQTKPQSVVCERNKSELGSV